MPQGRGYAQRLRAWLWKAFRATDNKNISSAARKFLISLRRKMLRATDEACFFFAIRAIMRRAMLCVNSHFGILELERYGSDGSDWAAESRRQVQIELSRCAKIGGEIPRKSPAIPGKFGDLSGSRTLSPLDLGSGRKRFFRPTGR